MGSTTRTVETLWNTGKESGSRDRPPFVIASEGSRLFAGRLTKVQYNYRAETDPSSDDPRLIGRTYAIPFEQVWRTCMKFVKERGRWRLLQADDLAGFIRVRCTTMVFRFEDDLEIRIGLDEHALTRVDIRAGSQKGRVDLGMNVRRIGRFFKKLDRLLDAGHGKILDPRETARLTRQT